MNEYQTDHQELLGAMLELSKERKRVVKRLPTLTFDRNTLQLLGVEEQQWRGREIPRHTETRQMLFTAYVGLVVNNEPFQPWARYLRQSFPDMKRDQGDAIGFFCEQLDQLGSLHAFAEGEIATVEDALPKPVYEEFLERMKQDTLGRYDSIRGDVLYGRGERVSAESRYLCSRCGLHFLATVLFAQAPYGPRVTHDLVWESELAWLFAQTELGAYSIPTDSTGHGRAGMRLDNYGRLETVAKNLFSQQISHEPLSVAVERSGDTPLRLKKELGRAREVLGMRRRKGNQQQWWARLPGELCGKCRARTQSN